MDTETISAFVFRLYWLFSCLCLTRRGWLCDFPPKYLELHLGCHTCWLSYFTLVCLWCGRTVTRSVTVTLLPNFLGWIDFLTHGASLRALHTRESSAIIKGDKPKFLVKIFGDVCKLGADYLEHRPHVLHPRVNPFPKRIIYRTGLLARMMCFRGRPHIVHQPFPFNVLSVLIFTTEESWLPVIKKLTLGRTRGWGGGGAGRGAWFGWMPPP